MERQAGGQAGGPEWSQYPGCRVLPHSVASVFTELLDSLAKAFLFYSKHSALLKICFKCYSCLKSTFIEAYLSTMTEES